VPAKRASAYPDNRSSDEPAPGRHHGTFGDDTRQEMTRLLPKRPAGCRTRRAGAYCEGENAQPTPTKQCKSDGRKDTNTTVFDTIRSELERERLSGIPLVQRLVDRHVRE